MYSFDEIIDRQGTDALNTDGFRGYIFHAGPEKVFPCADDEFVRMWVADMEFGLAPEIADAMRARLDRRIFGYTGIYNDEYYQILQAGFALPEKKYTLLTDKGFAAYQPDIPDTWIFEDGQVETVGIATPDRKPFVTMHCAGFPMLAVWANPKGPVICLEPWFGRTDDEGFTGNAEEKKSMQLLSGGSEKDISYSIIFH